MQQTAPAPPETKRQPPYGLWILNDDFHSLAYIVMALRKVFKYELEKCYELAMKANDEDEALVWSGALEHGELKQDQLKSVPAEIRAGKKLGHIQTRLEPMP